MEENLLRYFLGEAQPTTETIKPLNIDNVSFNVEGQMNNYYNSLVTKDEAYFIRYGGLGTPNGYDAIQVFNGQSLENKQALYLFNNLQIAGHTFAFIDLKQDEDGRFYGIGKYTDSSPEYYLILLNNFIQDGECKIRKYYTQTTLGIDDEIKQVVKDNNSATYYMLSNNKIYAFSINVLEGNSLQTYNFTDTGSITSSSVQNLSLIKENLVLLQANTNSNNTSIECKKLVINKNKSIEENYNLNVIYANSNQTFINFITIENNLFKIPYTTMASGGNYFNYLVVDLDGNVKTINYEGKVFGTFYAQFTGKYISIYEIYNQILTLLYYDGINIIEIFSEQKDYASFLNAKIIKQFNLYYIIGYSSINTILYSKNIYSVGYTSEPYYNNNFMIPQYLNLYSKANDVKSIIFSRDVINRFLAGNQLTSIFNIPNYLLNNITIHREIINGQTNLAIEDNNKSYIKNRFESLYMTYLYSLNVIDNTNSNNLTNIEGSNRIADSIWKTLDYLDSSFMKIRLVYENSDYAYTAIQRLQIEGSTATITYNVSADEGSGNITKIEYVSNDEKTIYATFYCNISRNSRITQTIEVEEG